MNNIYVHVHDQYIRHKALYKLYMYMYTYVPWLLEEVVVASVLLLVPVPVVLLLSALAVEAVAVGREIVTGEREVETTVVCWPALAARASSAELSRPRILDIAGNTSPAQRICTALNQTVW